MAPWAKSVFFNNLTRKANLKMLSNLKLADGANTKLASMVRNARKLLSDSDMSSPQREACRNKIEMFAHALVQDIDDGKTDVYSIAKSFGNQESWDAFSSKLKECGPSFEIDVADAD